MNTSPISKPDAFRASSAHTASKPTSRIVRYAIKSVIIALGLALGGILGLIIALFSGLIPFSC